MPSIRLEELSVFGRLALKLDKEFSELTRLREKIERLSLESESDLDHAVRLLSEFSRQGQTISGDMQEFSKALEEASLRSEAAAKSVGERARQVQERRQQRDELQEKLVRLDQDIQTANAGLLGGGKRETKTPSDDERARIKAQFTQLHARLADLIEPARKIKEEAASLKFRKIERDAQSMLDSLVALRAKLETLLA